MACEKEEKKLLENGFLDSLEQWQRIVETNRMHGSHYLLFWALDVLGCEAVALVAFQTSPQERETLASIWKKIICFMNQVVPFVHHEKTIYYDNLAQVCVVLGDLQEAKAAYHKAFEVSCLVSGENCVPTQKFRQLMENPPQNAYQLQQTYAKDDNKEEEDDDG